MYFVLKAASLLGVCSEYKNVLNNFCSIFEVDNGKLKVKFDNIATTNDFEQIKLRMITEDYTSQHSSFEMGKDFDSRRAHKNWLLGLIVGLKKELCEFGHADIYKAAITDLFTGQDKNGFWYPRRIPWITARILIGLSQAGYDASCDKVSKGIKYLFSALDGNNHWNAHTGGWNTIYETSSLCLEAIFRSGMKLNFQEKEGVNRVIEFLLQNKNVWMQDDKVVDGSATACCLLKHHKYSPDLSGYIQSLCEKRIYTLVAKNAELNLQEQQSCETTQIAWYVMDFCLDYLYTHLPDLLRDFITRSLQRNNNERTEIMNKDACIFISYSQDSQSVVRRVKRISAYLREKGYDVLCYADEPLGTNIISFMQKSESADIILILGSKTYREKSLGIKNYTGKGSGVQFENLIFSNMFITGNIEKIIPIAFERGSEFSESFPPPLNTNKGCIGYQISQRFLETLTQEIDIKLGGRKNV